jgi:hypothetical protein
MNKKAAEMTIGTIIIIILALVVLVVIIYGFSTGWGNLFDKILNFGGGKINVQTVIDSCNVACATQSGYDYCSLNRTVVFGDPAKDDLNKKEKIKYTCFSLQKEVTGLSCDNIDCSRS